MKLNKWLDIWLNKYVKLSVKRRTFCTYKEIIIKQILPQLGEKEIADLTGDDLQEFIVEKTTSGNLLTGKALASNTVIQIFGVLKQALSKAYILEHIKKDITKQVALPKIEEKEINAFEVWEQNKVIEKCLNSKKSNHLGIVICFYTGIRIGELLALTYDDIDFERKLLKINKTAYYLKEDGNSKIFVDAPKTKKSQRVIPLPEELISLLLKMRAAANSNFLISNRYGEMIETRSYQRTYERILKNANVKYRNFHSLRHTFATRALELGMDVKTVSEILGHKSPMITLNRYTHSMLSFKTDMMNKMCKSLIIA